jgi:hypothetical protein
MKFPKSVLLLLVIPLLSFSVHKYYLSLTQIEYNQESKSLEIIINVFMDDIELALNKDYNIDLQLTTKLELENPDQYFEKYLKDKLHFKLQGEEFHFNYLGKEYEGDLVYFYLEIPNVETPQPIEVHNQILLQHFEDQQNVVKLKVGKKRKSKILNRKNDKALLNF